MEEMLDIGLELMETREAMLALFRARLTWADQPEVLVGYYRGYANTVGLVKIAAEKFGGKPTVDYVSE